MLCCKACRKERGWFINSQNMELTKGPCEICRRDTVCYDVPLEVVQNLAPKSRPLFYCKKCGEERGWSVAEGVPQNFSRCGVCGVHTGCYMTSATLLNPPVSLDPPKDRPPLKEPPLGLKPEKFWYENMDYRRVLDIIDAMDRYAEAEKACPREWVTELSIRVRAMHRTGLGEEIE